MNKSRASVIAALLITGFAALYAGGSAVTGWEPSAGWLIQAIIHLGELLVVVALARSGVGELGRLARVGLTAAVAGQLIIAAAEVIFPGSPGLADVLFAVAPILTGAGLIIAGARIRAVLPLALGGYTILVLIPVMIGSGGPPAPAALWAIAGWDLLWFAVGASILNHTQAAAPMTAKVTVR